MICRLCLNSLIEEENSVCIFDSDQLYPELQLAQMIEKYLSLDVSLNDPISTNVCCDCIDHLKDFHTFWVLVNEKQNTLRNEFLEVKCDVEMSVGVGPAEGYEESPVDIKDVPLLCVTKAEMIPLADEYECIELNTSKQNMELGITDTIATNIDTDSIDEDAPLARLLSKHKLKYFQKARKKKMSKKNQLVENNQKNENRISDSIKKGGVVYRSKNNEKIIEGFMELCCDLCKHISATYSELRQHFYFFHERRPPFLKCCSSTFRKPSKLVEHIKWHTNPDIFKCDICFKVLRTKSYLQKHKDTAHDAYNSSSNDDQPSRNCNICNKNFRSRKCLENHILKHKNDKVHTCEKCQKGFATRQRLQRHTESIHDNLFSHICETCGKKFKFKPSFEKHVLEHQGIIEPPEQCKLCGRWLKNKHSLRLHRFRHDNTDVTCHLCGRVCISRTALRGHINYMHKRGKDFQCDYCEKSFKEARNLEEHMAIHTGSNLYSCPHCAKECRSKSNMYVHIKRYHVEEWIKTKQARSNNPIYKSKTNDTATSSSLPSS